jgi:hypothetical protein
VCDHRPVQWTDDMTVRLARGESMSSLVAYVREVVANRAAWPEVLAVLTERFALPFDDAGLVMDRVQGSRGFPGVG